MKRWFNVLTHFPQVPNTLLMLERSIDVGFDPLSDRI
jgi:hypothetical protein